MNIFGPKSGHFVKGVKSTRFISFPQKNANFCCIFGTFKTLKTKQILQQFLLGEKMKINLSIFYYFKMVGFNPKMFIV